MTSIEELRELIESTAKIARENSEAIRASQTESDKRWADGQKQWADGQKRWDEGLAEIKRLREESELRQARWDEGLAEIKRLREESELRQARWDEELVASRIESDRIWTALHREMKVLSHNVGQLGNLFGTYTEALFFPSLDRILREEFGMEVVRPRAIGRTKHGEEIEIDVLAHANDTLDLVFDVEIKTQLRQDGIKQILDHLNRFAKFFPEHRGKKAYGILGAISIPSGVKAKALKAGIYVASIRDDVFELLRPEGFEPRAFPI